LPVFKTAGLYLSQEDWEGMVAGVAGDHSQVTVAEFEAVCERERERRARVGCVCLKESGTERETEGEREKESDRKREGERESVCVCVREGHSGVRVRGSLVGHTQVNRLA